MVWKEAYVFGTEERKLKPIISFYDIKFLIDGNTGAKETSGRQD